MYRLALVLGFAAIAPAQTRTVSQVSQPDLRWEMMGPFGGSAAVVAVDPNRPGRGVAAGSNGVLFPTRNQGERWQPIQFPGQLRTTLHAFAIDSVHGGAYYA